MNCCGKNLNYQFTQEAANVSDSHYASATMFALGFTNEHKIAG
jgi:hypothetical protein